MKKDTLTVAAIGDLHAYERINPDHETLFTRISQEADILVISGDLTNSGQPGEARNLATELQYCSIPVVAVPGNHDYQSGKIDEVKHMLYDANIHFLDDQPFEYKDVGFTGVKGFGGGFDKYMLTAFGENATKDFVTEAVNESLKLENSLKYLETSRTVVVLHYAPIRETVQGEPLELYPYLGCSRLAETIDRFPVSAVFHGHAHHGSREGHTQGGIPVYNCSLDIWKKHEESFLKVII